MKKFSLLLEVKSYRTSMSYRKGNLYAHQSRKPATLCTGYRVKQRKECCSKKSKCCCGKADASLHPANRSMDGTGNNLSYPTWGAANQPLLRLSPPDYADGYNAMAVRGEANPNPRVVSNVVCQCVEDGEVCPPDPELTTFVWVWGQFIDHLLDLSAEGGEPETIVTPDDDRYPDYKIHFTRALPVFGTGSTPDNVRQQANVISSYCDASNVYGSDPTRANQLRALNGTGKLLTTTLAKGEIGLPYNTVGAANALPPGPSDPSEFFLAGDVRANENVLLLSMHTLFVRYHNHLCDLLVKENPDWLGQDQVIYEYARKIVGGVMQQITYEEFLPAILGEGGIGPYKGYDDECDASICTEFSTVAYRLGHTMVNKQLLDGRQSLELRDAFFNPTYVAENGTDGLLAGACRQRMERIDDKITEELRSFLFQTPDPNTKMMLDLAVLNIQRARDMGICGYNALRRAFGLRTKGFSQITANRETQRILRELYGDDVEAIDPWVGCLCEDKLRKPGCRVGELLFTILSDQFDRTRRGDYYWYENDPALSSRWKNIIKHTTLSRVLAECTSYQNWPEDVFRLN